MRKITKRSAAIITASIVALGGGAAWAASNGWFQSGKNEASADAAQIRAVDATVVATGKLWPGKTQNGTLSVKNPNDFPVKITGVDTTTAPVVVVTPAGSLSTKPDCTPANANITLEPDAWGGGVTVTGTNQTAPTTVGTLTNIIKMGTGAPASCAGATFKVTFVTTGDSA